MATKTKNKTVTSPYSLSITFGDKTFKSTGKSALETLESLETPIKITTKGFLTITNGDKSIDQWFMPFRAKRLFYPMFRTFYAKKLEYLLKNA